MWSMFDNDDNDDAPRRALEECPGCGAEITHDDDFCHECGHGFEHLHAHREDALDDEDGSDAPCPMCASGTLTALDHGRVQCDACGYMPRDEG